MYDQISGVGPSNLRILNVTTGEKTILWNEAVEGYAVDTEARLLVLSDALESVTQGSFFVDWGGASRAFAADIFWVIAYRGGTQTQFIGFDGDKVKGIARDGTLSTISDRGYGALSLSPNRSYYVLYQNPNIAYDEITGIGLFSETNEFMRTIVEGDAEPVAWRPDSKGLFYNQSETLYYTAIPDGTPVMIDTNTVTEAVWVGQ